MDGIRVNTVAPCYTRTQRSKPALKVGGAFCSGRTDDPSMCANIDRLRDNYWLLVKWCVGSALVSWQGREITPPLQVVAGTQTVCGVMSQAAWMVPAFTSLHLHDAQSEGQWQRGFIERDNRPEPAQGARYNDRATQAFASRSAIESGQICQRRHNFWPRRR